MCYRLPMRSLLLLAAALFSAAPVLAQPCDGDMTVVRVNTIKPGKLDTFLAAVAAHKAWYRANRITDNELFTVRILVRDPATRAYKNSDTEVMTLHVRPPFDRLPNRGDAAWNAYVQQYKESSELKSEYLTCMPKSGR
jgi:hypothetical protein